MATKDNTMDKQRKTFLINRGTDDVRGQDQRNDRELLETNLRRTLQCVLYDKMLDVKFMFGCVGHVMFLVNVDSKTSARYVDGVMKDALGVNYSAIPWNTSSSGEKFVPPLKNNATSGNPQKTKASIERHAEEVFQSSASGKAFLLRVLNVGGRSSEISIDTYSYSGEACNLIKTATEIETEDRHIDVGGGEGQEEAAPAPPFGTGSGLVSTTPAASSSSSACWSTATIRSNGTRRIDNNMESVVMPTATACSSNGDSSSNNSSSSNSNTTIAACTTTANITAASLLPILPPSASLPEQSETLSPSSLIARRSSFFGNRPGCSKWGIGTADAVPAAAEGSASFDSANPLGTGEYHRYTDSGASTAPLSGYTIPSIGTAPLLSSSQPCVVVESNGLSVFDPAASAAIRDNMTSSDSQLYGGGGTPLVGAGAANRAGTGGGNGVEMLRYGVEEDLPRSEFSRQYPSHGGGKERGDVVRTSAQPSPVSPIVMAEVAKWLKQGQSPRPSMSRDSSLSSSNSASKRMIGAIARVSFGALTGTIPGYSFGGVQISGSNSRPRVPRSHSEELINRPEQGSQQPPTHDGNDRRASITHPSLAPGEGSLDAGNPRGTSSSSRFLPRPNPSQSALSSSLDRILIPSPILSQRPVSSTNEIISPFRPQPGSHSNGCAPSLNPSQSHGYNSMELKPFPPSSPPCSQFISSTNRFHNRFNLPSTQSLSLNGQAAGTAESAAISSHRKVVSMPSSTALSAPKLTPLACTRLGKSITDEENLPAGGCRPLEDSLEDLRLGEWGQSETMGTRQRDRSALQQAQTTSSELCSRNSFENFPFEGEWVQPPAAAPEEGSAQACNPGSRSMSSSDLLHQISSTSSIESLVNILDNVGDDSSSCDEVKFSEDHDSFRKLAGTVSSGLFSAGGSFGHSAKASGKMRKRDYIRKHAQKAINLVDAMLRSSSRSDDCEQTKPVKRPLSRGSTISDEPPRQAMRQGNSGEQSPLEEVYSVLRAGMIDNPNHWESSLIYALSSMSSLTGSMDLDSTEPQAAFEGVEVKAHGQVGEKGGAGAGDGGTCGDAGDILDGKEQASRPSF